METIFISPAKATFLGIPCVFFFVLIPAVSISLFSYIMVRRLNPLLKAAPDVRTDRPGKRLLGMFKYAVAQYRQPRYLFAGVLHMMLFAGFIIISVHSVTLVLIGIVDGFVFPGLGGALGRVYAVLKEIGATAILLAAVTAMIRRGLFTPERYAVPEKYGKGHTAEAVFVLVLISILVVSDGFFEGSRAVASLQDGFSLHAGVPGTVTWAASVVLAGASLGTCQSVHLGAYLVHELVFFFFLCFLPLGKHFHVITSLPNVFLMKLDKGTVKPVRWGVDEEKVEDLESFGIKTFEDFTWKHMLDFYSCADCGRCSDNCPANAAGRPLSPRFISIKCRDYAFKKYPLWGPPLELPPLVGPVLAEDEIWSCTTCGACEQECPLMIEYIDKIVDVRRGMVDEGMVPQTLQKPLGALEKRGNPYGKMERKRADWTRELGEGLPVKVLDKSGTAEILFFVDSITSYDDRMQQIGRSAVRVLTAAGMDFGILGPAEKDSGHEVRRFGEEMLFMELRAQNTEAIIRTGAGRIVTADPHAYNALKHDYGAIPPVFHMSQVIAEQIAAGRIRLAAVEDSDPVYVYHDPCYLGRHNGLYDVPRTVLDAIPGLTRVEMQRCKDRSFCCGGGGLMLYYEAEEQTRMGNIRVEMARDAGASVIVTACPFCLVNIEDAIKTSGMEGRMRVMDLVELVARQIST